MTHGVDWSMYEDSKLEDILLGVIYRTRHSQGYRRAAGERLADVDPVSGMTRSESKVLPIGHSQWISGHEFALQSPLFPDKLATACLGLYWKSRMCPLSPDEETLMRELGQRPDLTEEKWLELAPKPKSNWTDDENKAHAELTYRWKRCLLRMAGKGYVAIKPPVVYVSESEHVASDAFASGLGRDGMPRVAHATHIGLDEAERRIKGTRLANGAYSQLAVAPEHVLAHARSATPWAARMASTERAGTG